MTNTTYALSRTRLQWTLGVLALAPAISGLQVVAQGANGTPGDSPRVSPTVDGELRYANVFKIATAPLILSQLKSVEDSPALTAALGAVFAGGLARLVSWKQAGRPHPVAVVAIGLEVGVVPLVQLWRRRLTSGRV